MFIAVPVNSRFCCGLAGPMFIAVPVSSRFCLGFGDSDIHSGS